MFFGVPNLGTELADGAAKILTVLSTVFNVNRNVLLDLTSKSQRLANIAGEFRQIRHEHKIPVISFFETEKYNSASGLVSIRLPFAISRYLTFCTALKSYSNDLTMNPVNGPCDPRFVLVLKLADRQSLDIVFCYDFRAYH